jgi:predicted transcriptional regulator
VETVTTISKILKAERKRLDLTQGELAAKLDCTQSCAATGSLLNTPEWITSAQAG